MGDPRPDAEIETIASGGAVAPRLSAGGAAADDHGPVEVSPEHYRVEGEFARGGMGRILLARDRRLDRTVALKELLEGAGPGAASRFVREALVTARLQHPAIVPVYEAGRWPGGRPFYAMKLKGSLARVVQWLGRGEEAEALFRETLAIRRRLEGDRSPGVAATLNNLGVLLAQRGDWKAAAPLHREALEIIRAVRGPEHPEVAAGMSSLGAALEETGDLAGAETFYRDSLAMRLKLLGPEHPDVTRSRYALASLLRARGEPAGAVAECRQVLALRGRALSEAHPMVAAAQQVLGLALLDLGRTHEAETVLRESLELRRKALPPGHWMIASSESVLGACLTARRRFPEAEELLRRAHAALESSLGPRHDRTLEARRRLDDLHRARESPGVGAETSGMATSRPR